MMAETCPVILFVDDEDALVREFPQMLKWDREVEVLSAASVDEAFQHIEQVETIDLAILDFQLPSDRCEQIPAIMRQDGRELGLLIGERLRRRFPDTPILFWSGSADQELRAKALRLPNSYSFPKSVGPRFIQHIVYEILDSPDRRPKPRAFIVHGHAEQLLAELRDWLITELNVPEPVVLRDMRSGGETLIDKLEKYALTAEMVFVLLTPDDVVVNDDDGSRTCRARQNVIFEMGYFFGRLGRRTGNIVLLRSGPVEMPSDLHGMITIDVSDGITAAAEEIRREIDRPPSSSSSLR